MLIPFIVALVLIVLLVLIIKKPDLFKNLLSKLKKTEDSSSSDQLSTPYFEDKKSLTDKFLGLRVGDFASFKMDPFSDSLNRDFQLTGRGICYCLSHNRGNFRRKGGEYFLFSFDEEIFFIKRPDGWYGFYKSIILHGDEVSAFDEAGIIFSQGGQILRSHSFMWENINLSILDVGYLEYQHQEGHLHLETGNMIKYMLAEEKKGDETTIYFLENLKGETGTDRIWVGQYFGMDFDSQIVEIFPQKR